MAEPSPSRANAVIATPTEATRVPLRPTLSVVVPVYGGEDMIVENLRVIRAAVEAGVGEEFEIIVVSDGSIDETADRLLDSEHSGQIRLIHYDRNLGKGYAVKVGGLAARGDWVAFIDADLDLDPAAIGVYFEIARREDLDFAIGSKRHPESEVVYPRSRRVASWCYQELNRFLFGLDVRDTQVGLKVFPRRVAQEVLPLLLVKQYAFDLELLVVAGALGYGHIRELPVRLEYKFTGSGVRSAAAARALFDTAAVFYRLRILRTYERKRRMLRLADPMWLWDDPPLVSVIGGDAEAARRLDYPRVEILESRAGPESARAAGGELLAIVPSGARPAGNWLASAVPFFARPEVAAVVAPMLTPLRATLRERAAAAVLESRLGGGSRRSRYFPGNVRIVRDQPVENIVARRADYLAALEADVGDEQLIGWLAERGRRTIYTPDTSIAAPPPPLFRPHLRGTRRHARARGAAARSTRGDSLSAATTLSLAPAACAALGLTLFAFGSADSRRVGARLVIAYGAAVTGSAALAALRFRSMRVGVLAVPALIATQATYVAGFLHGLARGR